MMIDDETAKQEAESRSIPRTADYRRFHVVASFPVLGFIDIDVVVVSEFIFSDSLLTDKSPPSDMDSGFNFEHFY